MAALGAQSIASSYEQLLHVDADGGGNSTTHVSVKDGDNGTTFGFTIASDALMMSSTNRLEFGDTGTYIFQSADGVLDLVSDTEIEINATTIDMNGALDLSGNAQLSGTVTVGADGSGTDVIFYSGTTGDNLTWDASDEKLIITGTDSQTALDVADGNVSITDDLAVDGTSNLDNTDIDGTLAVDGATISLDATTSFNIDNSNTSNGITIGTATSAVPISIGHATSETTVNDNLSVTGDMAVDGTANLDEVDIDGAVQIDNTITVGADDQGYDVIFYGDTASSNMTWDTSEDDLVLNDSRLVIDQDDNISAIHIDSESTSAGVLYLDASATTTGFGLEVVTNGLTSGTMASFSSNSSSASTRNLVSIVNDHASATGATCLNIDQDANQKGIDINNVCTTSYGMLVQADALTTGKIGYFYSNSSDNSTRNLVEITNDHASADNAVGLLIQQDGADASIELTGNGSIKFPGTQGASSDANSLDDYEEGTWQPAFVCGTSGSITADAGASLGTYTKIGNMVFLSSHIEVSAVSSPVGTLRISGMPFAVNDDTAGEDSGVAAGTIDAAGLASSLNVLQISADAGGSVMKVTEFDGTYRVDDAANHFGTSTDIRIAIAYKV